jgi:hypothetical protein
MSEADSGPVADDASEQIDVADSGSQKSDAGEADLTLDSALEAAFEDAGKAAEAEGPSSEDTAGDERGDEEPVATDKASTSEEDAPASIHAPEHWPAERKAAFDALPTPEAKNAILAMAKDLEAGATRKSQELSEQAKFADAIRNELTDEDRQVMAANGQDEIAGLRQLLALNRYARKDPAGYVRHVSKLLGVSADAAGTPQPSEQNPPANGHDPDPAPIQQRQQADLPSLIDQHVSHALQQARIADAGVLFDRFSSEKDATGNPVRPHAETVKGMMASLANLPQYASLPTSAESYQTLYDVAIRAHPDTRDGVIAAEIAAKTAAEDEARKKAAEIEKAKRAQGPRTAHGSQPGQSRSSADSIDDILGEEIARHTV